MIDNKAFGTPPTMVEGVDLTKFQSPASPYSAHDRWQDLTGKVEIRGRILTEALEDVINSPVYLPQGDGR